MSASPEPKRRRTDLAIEAELAATRRELEKVDELLRTLLRGPFGRLERLEVARSIDEDSDGFALAPDVERLLLAGASRCAAGSGGWCPVCLEQEPPDVTFGALPWLRLSCGHHAHVSCLQRWMDARPNGDADDEDMTAEPGCPVCRRPL